MTDIFPQRAAEARCEKGKETEVKNGIIFTIILAVFGIIKLFGKLLKAVLQVLANLIVFFGLYIPLFYFAFGLILLGVTDFRFGGTGPYEILYYIGMGLCCLGSVIISIRNLLVRPISHVFAPFGRYLEESRRRKEEERDRDEDDRRDRDRRYYDRDDRDRRYYDRDDRDRRYYDRDDRDRRYYDRDDRDDRDRYDRDDRDYYDGDREDRRYDGDPRDRRDYEEDRREGRYPYPPRDYRSDRDDRAYERREPRPPYRYEEAGYRQEVGRDPREEHPDDRRRGGEYERPLIYYSQRRPGVLVKEYSDRFELYQEDADGRRYIGTEYKDE